MEETQQKPNGNSRKGFASNPQNINRAGRPKGSRNKASLKRARELMDTDSLEAAQILSAIMRNDKDFLETSVDVKMELRAKVAKDIIDKSIASEKDNKHLEEVTEKAKEKALDDLPEIEDEEVSFSTSAIDDTLQ